MIATVQRDFHDIGNNLVGMILEGATKKNIEGKEVTPFLLERISQLTKGESLKSNIALVCNIDLKSSGHI